MPTTFTSKPVCRFCGACKPAEADRTAEPRKAEVDEKGADAGFFWVKGCVTTKNCSILKEKGCKAWVWKSIWMLH